MTAQFFMKPLKISLKMNSNTKKNYSAYKNNFNTVFFVSSLDRESKQAPGLLRSLFRLGY